jgi:3-oxoacyl-[acyl-carrier protein] reductase
MGRKIIITGASSDIGIAICNKIIQNDDQVILQSFSNTNKLVAGLRENIRHSKIVSVDFGNQNAVDKFCEDISDTDILVNAAAVTRTGLLPSIRDFEIEQMISVNILAVVKICRKVIPAMVAKRNGCIVNLSSVAAQRGNKGQSVYAGTKGFIESFTRSLASEYGSRGVRVNCVAPGPINAGQLSLLLDYAKDEVEKSIVSKRLGTPDDVANTVAFLCSNDSDFINGECISVNGGFCRGV